MVDFIYQLRRYGSVHIAFRAAILGGDALDSLQKQLGKNGSVLLKEKARGSSAACGYVSNWMCEKETALQVNI